MATTSWRHPSTISSQTRIGGTASWTNTSNAGASDDVYATAGLVLNGSHWLWATDFGFGTGDIPSGSTITGFEVLWERKMSTGFPVLSPTLHRSYYYPIKGGALHGTQKTVDADLPATDTQESQGGAGDMWGGTFSDADARASTTGIALAYFTDHFDSATVSVDDIQIRWHYTPPSTGSGDFFKLF